MNVSSKQPHMGPLSRPSEQPTVCGYVPIVLPNETRFVQRTLDGDIVVRLFTGLDPRVMAYFEHFVGSTIEREPVSLYKSELDALCDYVRQTKS